MTREPIWECLNRSCPDYRKAVKPTERGTCPTCGKGKIVHHWPEDAARRSVGRRDD